MDVSSPAWSPRRSVASLLNAVLAVMMMALPSLGLGSACTLQINIPRNLKVSHTQGKSFSLRCPVRLCSHSQDLPIVSWCKIEESTVCEPVGQDNHVTTGWEDNKTKNEAVYLLRFHLLQRNDTGFYKCSATYNKEQIIGSTIEVTLSDETMAAATTLNMLCSNNTNSTSTPTNSVLEQFKVLTYIMASTAGLCLLIIIISLLVFYQRRRRRWGKHGSSSDPETADEVQFVATAPSLENCLDSSKASCPLAKEITTAPTETTYDNAHLGYRPSFPLSPEEDSIIYADLNHETKKAHLQIEEESDVEYATVRLK